MIAYRYNYEPTNLKADSSPPAKARWARFKLLRCTFGFNIAKGEWRLSKKLAGGGPLFDRGIYSRNRLPLYLTGEESGTHRGQCRVIDQDGRFNEGEENVSGSNEVPIRHCSQLQ